MIEFLDNMWNGTNEKVTCHGAAKCITCGLVMPYWKKMKMMKVLKMHGWKYAFLPDKSGMMCGDCVKEVQNDPS